MQNKYQILNFKIYSFILSSFFFTIEFLRHILLSFFVFFSIYELLQKFKTGSMWTIWFNTIADAWNDGQKKKTNEKVLFCFDVLGYVHPVWVTKKNSFDSFHTYIMDLLFLKLMSKDQEWQCQTRTKEYSKPGSQTVNIFKLEWQILWKIRQLSIM